MCYAHYQSTPSTPRASATQIPTAATMEKQIATSASAHQHTATGGCVSCQMASGSTHRHEDPIASLLGHIFSGRKSTTSTPTSSGASTPFYKRSAHSSRVDVHKE